jgi:hypothetical protein
MAKRSTVVEATRRRLLERCDNADAAEGGEPAAITLSTTTLRALVLNYAEPTRKRAKKGKR